MEPTEEEVQRQFEYWSRFYDKSVVLYHYSAPKVTAESVIPHLRGEEKIIDLACGTGLSGQYYPRCHMHGVDTSQGMVNIALQRGYQASVGDIRKTSYADNTFDVSLCVGVLEFYKDKQPFIDEMKRIVKPRGIIAFTIEAQEFRNLYPCNRLDLDSLLDRNNLEPLSIDTFRAYRHPPQESTVVDHYYHLSVVKNIE